jgi:hypothetical protein
LGIRHVLWNHRGLMDIRGDNPPPLFAFYPCGISWPLVFRATREFVQAAQSMGSYLRGLTPAPVKETTKVGLAVTFAS